MNLIKLINKLIQITTQALSVTLGIITLMVRSNDTIKLTPEKVAQHMAEIKCSNRDIGRLQVHLGGIQLQLGCG